MIAKIRTPPPLRDLPSITFCTEDGEREFHPALRIATIRHLSSAIDAEFPNARRVGLIWHTEPELVLLWLAILASGREPLLLQYPNEKQNIVHWRESIAVSIEAAELGGLVIADDPRLNEIDFVETYCPKPEEFTMAAEGCRRRGIRLEGAFLQMSSGTTGHRKPIRFDLSDVATHVNRFNQVLGLGPTDKIASWLPLYHDMGFVACFLMPMLLGIPLVLIDPMKWIRRPALLSEAIRKHGCTVCYMPNFGFEVMSRQAEHAPMPTMRHWISCSEPAYPETMQRFSEAFDVPDKALSVCYAMAENIFAVTFRSGMRNFQVEGRNSLSCGKPILGTEISIREEGEIWVRSEISLKSYFNSASIVDTDGYYPTGDLGRIVDGELVVTGRKRDMINIAGRKYMLNDLDQALLGLVPEAKGRAAAVPWRNDRLGTETPLLLVEAEDFFLRTDQRAIGTALGQDIGIESAEVVFVPPRFIAKTSSGKTNRGNTAEYYRHTLAWQKEGRSYPRTIEESLAAYYSEVPWDWPIHELFDSLGLTSLSILLDEFDLTLNPKLSINGHLACHRERHADSGAAASAAAPAHLSIVSLADARLTRRWNDTHLETISRALGCPVSFEYLCLPPVPVVLSDLIFHDYFLPREDEKEKYREITKAISTLKKASIVLVDDVAELLFGEGFFPFLNHRLHRSDQADLLIYRWQQYARNHHNLPVGVANLFGTTELRNEYIDRLGQYLGVPVFRIATLKSLESITRHWDYVERVNADWTMTLDSNTDALVDALADFMSEHKTSLPMRHEPMRSGIRHVGLVHFCCMAANKRRLDDLVERYNRFCIFGPQASLPYLRKRLDALGKTYVVADQSADLRAIEDQFDCVVQTGTTGLPKTEKPVFQIFWAAWEYEVHLHPDAYADLNSRSFHADPQDIQNELRLIGDLPSTPSEAIRALKKYLHESEKAEHAVPAGKPAGERPQRRAPIVEIYPEFLAVDETNYADAERLLESGQKEKAYSLIETMVNNGTALWQAHNDLGVFSLERGDIDKAIGHLEVASSLEKSSTYALRNLAEACAQIGRVAEALAACANILRLEPEDPDVPLFVKNLLLGSKATIGDNSWLLPEWPDQQRELHRLCKLVDSYEQQLASMNAKNTFFIQAKKVLNNLL